MTGFYSPSYLQSQKTPLSLVPQCGKCGIYKDCKSPMMKVSGKGRRKVLVVAEAPGENEDAKGIQLIGNAGMKLVWLLDNIGVDMRKDCWLTNALICRPKDAQGQNRKPTNDELEWCRPNLLKTINALKPDVIIPLGVAAIASVIALAWKEGEVDNVERWANWKIPSTKLNAWICPTYHPSYLLREKNMAAQLHVQRHLKAAFELEGKPWQKIPDWKSKVYVEMDHHKAAASVRTLMAYNEPLAFDYETTTLKPDGQYAQIICCAVSNGKTSVAYPWYGEAIIATGELIRSDIPKIASNLDFEERWTRKAFGRGVKNWHTDTVLRAHWLDCRRGICSLKFQSFVLLGVEDYDSHLKPYMAGKGCNEPNRLREVEPNTLLTYNALDSLFEVLVAQKQWESEQ